MSALPPRPAAMALCISKPVLLSAVPMTQREFATYINHPDPDPALPVEFEGVMVEAFFPPRPATDPRHHGEINWMLKGDFERYFSTGSDLSFGQAIEAVRRDWMIARAAWDGTERVRLHASSRAPYLAKQYPEGREVAYWQPTQADMLATDWMIVGDDAPAIPPAPAP